MKRLLLTCGCALLAAAMATTAEASILGGGLTFNGVTDYLIDDNLGRVVDVNDNNAVDKGDVIQGMFLFDSVGRDGTTPVTALAMNSVYGIYSFAITDIGSTTIDVFGTSVPVPLVTLGAATGTNSLSTILSDAGFTTSDLNSNTSDYSQAVIALVEASTAPTSLADFDISSAFVDTVSGAIGGQISGTDWSLDAVLGLVDSVQDYQEIRIVKAGVTHDYLNDGVNPADTLGEFRGAYSVIGHAFDSSTVFLPVSSTSFDGSQHTSDFASYNTTQIKTLDSSVDGSLLDSGFNFRGVGTFQINAIPEPASLAIWGLGFGVVTVGSRVRRKLRKNAAA